MPVVERQPYLRYRLRHRREDRRRLVLAALGSLPVALLLLGFGLLVASLPEPSSELGRPPAQVQMLDLSPSQWAANRQAEGETDRRAGPQTQAPQLATPAPEQKPAEKKPEPPKIPGQIVDVAPTPDTNPPADTHRYSEYNTHVQRETQSQQKSAFYKNAMPRHTTVAKPQKLPGKDAGDKVMAIGQPSVGKQRQAERAREGGHKLEIPDVKPRQQLAVAPGKNGELPERSATEGVHGNSSRFRVQEGKGEGESAQAFGTGGTGSKLNLVPSQSILDRIAGAPAPDHLEGVDEGEGTFLNTREWKYAGFFNRVKQSVAEHWDPGSVMRRRDPSGQIYGWRDRRTILSITLDREGGVRELTVERSCGVDFLDEEAMGAFKRAQPFLNPPPALVDANGEIKFSFGFFLQMNSGGLMQIFRGSPPQ